MAQVEAGQALAAIEHLAHIVDLAGVEVLQVGDGGELRHIGEPAVGAGGPGGSKGGVEHHGGHTAGLGLPLGRVAILVHRVCALGVEESPSVGIEGEGLPVVREYGVGGATVGQVSGVAVAAVDACVLFVDVAGVVGGAPSADDACAKREHEVGGGDSCRCPAAGDEDDVECAATGEHGAHVGDVGGVEAAQVEGGEDVASVEHEIHGGDAGRVEVREVKGLQALTKLEHGVHSGDVGRVER